MVDVRVVSWPFSVHVLRHILFISKCFCPGVVPGNNLTYLSLNQVIKYPCLNRPTELV